MNLKIISGLICIMVGGAIYGAPSLQISRLSEGKYQDWRQFDLARTAKAAAYDNLEISFRKKTLNRLEEFNVIVKNISEEMVFLRLRLGSEKLPDGGGFWDGFEYHSPLNETLAPKGDRHIFPAVAYLSGKSLQLIGVSPETICSRFERSCIIEEKKAQLFFDIFWAVKPGEEITTDFIAMKMAGADSYVEGVENIYHNYPSRFRPVDGIDPRLYGVGGYMGGAAGVRDYQLEEARRLGFDWEWYYNSYQKAGDIYPTPEYWDSKQGYKSERSHAKSDVPGTIEDWKKYHRERSRVGNYTSALFYYYLQQYCNSELLHKVYPDSIWRTVDGKTGYKTSGWAEEGWAEYAWSGKCGSYGRKTRQDLARLWKEFEFAGFALDCAIGDTRYYGPLAMEENHRAFDDQGRVFVTEGVALSYNMDYTRQLPPQKNGRRAGSVINEPYTYLPIFHCDAVIHEMPPFERTDLIGTRRLMLGQKPYFWWKGWYVEPLLDWEKISKEQINEAMTGVMDYTIMMSLRYGVVPTIFFSRGYPDMIRLRPIFANLMKLGWRAAPFAWVDGKEGAENPWALSLPVWVSRFGDHENSYLTLCNPKREPLKGGFRIQTGKFNANGLVYADINGTILTNKVSDNETVIDVELPGHGYLILRKVGSGKKGVVTTEISTQPDGGEMVKVSPLNNQSETVLAGKPVTYEPADEAWLGALMLSDDKVPYAVIAGIPEEIKATGYPVTNLKTYSSYYQVRRYRADQRMWGMIGHFKDKLLYPVVPPGDPRTEKAPTVFAIGAEARKKYFPESKARDTVVCRRAGSQHVVGFFPGKLSEAELILDFLHKLDRYYPFYGGIMDAWALKCGAYGKTYSKSKNTFADAIGSPTQPSKHGLKPNEIGILGFNDALYIRSSFSDSQDVVSSIIKGKNGQIEFSNARLVNAGLPLVPGSFFDGHQPIHNVVDETAPVFVNRGYVGGNHGSLTILEITSSGHGLTGKELGTEFTAGNRKYYPIKVIDENRFWIMSENIGKDGFWVFDRNSVKQQLIRSSDQKVINVSKAVSSQILPNIRINSQKYFVDGKELGLNGTMKSGKKITIRESYDIIAPDAILEAVVRTPGRQVDFIDPSFPSIITVDSDYEFQSGGSCILKQNFIFNRTMQWGFMGLVQTLPLRVLKKTQFLEYMIPKTLPFEQDGVKYDFSGLQDFTGAVPTIEFTGNRLADAANLPDRFIQLLGDTDKEGKKSYNAGLVLGYSLTEGITVPSIRVKQVTKPVWIFRTKKSYPMAIDGKYGNIIKAGTELRAVSYRQYFKPGNLTAYAPGSYIHESDGELFIYLNYIDKVRDDMVRIPQGWRDAEISVIERSSGVEFTREKAILKISTATDREYLVLKLNGEK